MVLLLLSYLSHIYLLSLDWIKVRFIGIREISRDKLGFVSILQSAACVSYQQFSQPKRELYGLMRALQTSRYWLLGCRKLIVEMDAKYLKGMLSNLGIGPNATIICWVKEVLMYHFTLCHVLGKTFSMDGLSRRVKQPDNEEYEEVNSELVDYPKTMKFKYPNQLNNEE